MHEISQEKLKQLLGEAFDAGYESSFEFRDQCIEDILAGHQQSCQEEQYRIYKAAELRNMPAGSIFHHSVRGRCWIVESAKYLKQMRFERSTPARISLVTDGDPWNSPMKLLHAVK